MLLPSLHSDKKGDSFLLAMLSSNVPGVDKLEFKASLNFSSLEDNVGLSVFYVYAPIPFI